MIYTAGNSTLRGVNTFVLLALGRGGRKGRKRPENISFQFSPQGGCAVNSGISEIGDDTVSADRMDLYPPPETGPVRSEYKNGVNSKRHFLISPHRIFGRRKTCRPPPRAAEPPCIPRSVGGGGGGGYYTWFSISQSAIFISPEFRICAVSERNAGSKTSEAGRYVDTKWIWRPKYAL